MMRILLLGCVVAAGFLAVATSLTQVQPGERAVVFRFGAIREERPGPGLYVGLPFGIDRVERVAIGRVRKVAVGFVPRKTEEGEEETPAGQLLTGDHNLVNVQGEVHYTVREDEVDRYVVQRDRVDTVLAWLSESIMAEWIAGQEVQAILLRGQQALRRRLLDDLPRRLAPYGLGIQIEEVSLKPMVPPEQVRDEFDRVNQAETEIETKINQARQEANSKLREAQAERFALDRLAQAYARETRLAAEADAGRFLTRLDRYRLILGANPSYLDTLWLEEMTRLYARMSAAGRIDLLDDFLNKGGLSIIEGPPRKR